MKFLKYCGFIGICGLLIVTSVSAQSTTPTPTTSTIRDNIKKQVTEELKEIKQSVSKRAWLGTVSAKSDTGITLTTLSGKTRTIIITTDTTIKLTGGKEGTLSDLKEKDYVLVMGNVDGAGVMTAIRLLVTGKPVEDKRKVLFGTITKISTTSLTLETSAKETWTVKLSSAVKYNGKTKSTDLEENSKIVVLGTITGTTSLSAKLIHLFL